MPSSSSLEGLDAPDVGFVAAFGSYVAAILSMAFVTGAIAAGAAVSTIVSGITTVVTVGLVIGALLASRLTGVAERLGSSRRSLLLPFTPPLGFAAVSIGALLGPFSAGTAVGAGIGAFVTSLCAFLLASMARTRFARVMAPGEPILTIPRLNPRESWTMAGLALALVVVGGTTFARGNVIGFGVILTGLVFLFAAGSTHLSRRRLRQGRSARSGRYPTRFGGEWRQDLVDPVNSRYLPEVAVHETGVVTHSQGTERRFVPWDRVADVRLSADELRIVCRRGLDIRCDRSVIDDPEEAYEAIERVRAEAAASAERESAQSAERESAPSAENDPGVDYSSGADPSDRTVEVDRE